MNKSVLVNALLNKAGLGSVSVDSIMQPVQDKAQELRAFQQRCYDEEDALAAQISDLQARAKLLNTEGERAGRVAQQLESLVL